jgi:hypothetical protein
LEASGEEILWRAYELPVNLPEKLRRDKIKFLLLFIPFSAFLVGTLWYFIALYFNNISAVSMLFVWGVLYTMFFAFLALLAHTFLYWSAECRVGYNLLRTWYPAGELENYTQFYAITRQHVVKKSLDVAVKQSFPQDFGWRLFRRTREKRNLIPYFSTPSPALASIISVEKDIEIISTAAIARVQQIRVSNSFIMGTEGAGNGTRTLVQISLADPNSPLAHVAQPTLGGIVAETATHMPITFAKNFIATLQLVIPSSAVARSTTLH